MDAVATGLRIKCLTCVEDFTMEGVNEHAVELLLIQPGKPTQNSFIESFNGRFQDKCMNEHWFSDIIHTRKIIND